MPSFQYSQSGQALRVAETRPGHCVLPAGSRPKRTRVIEGESNVVPLIGYRWDGTPFRADDMAIRRDERGRQVRQAFGFLALLFGA